MEINRQMLETMEENKSGPPLSVSRNEVPFVVDKMKDGPKFVDKTKTVCRQGSVHGEVRRPVASTVDTCRTRKLKQSRVRRTCCQTICEGQYGRAVMETFVWIFFPLTFVKNRPGRSHAYCSYI